MIIILSRLMAHPKAKFALNCWVVFSLAIHELVLHLLIAMSSIPLSASLAVHLLSSSLKYIELIIFILVTLYVLVDLGKVCWPYKCHMLSLVGFFALLSHCCYSVLVPVAIASLCL